MSIPNEGKSEADYLEEAKRNWPKSQEPQKNISKAAFSGITSPEQDTKIEEKRNIVIELVKDVGQQREEIDIIKQKIDVIAQHIQALISTVDNQSENRNTLTGQTAQPQNIAATTKGLSLDNIEALGSVAEKIINIYKGVKGGDVQPAIISQDYINEKMKKSVTDNFELGETILDAVKETLKKKAVKNIVSEALPKGDMLHGPQ